MIIDIIFIIALSILGGIGLIGMARWARRKNEALKNKGIWKVADAVNDAIQRNDGLDILIGFLTGQLSNIETVIGKALAFILLLVLIMFILWGVYLGFVLLFQ
jgi:hypothetical protein